MKRLTSLVLAAGLLAVCLFAVPAPGNSADREVIIGTAKDTQTSPGIVIAQEKGFFAKHGLKVDIRFFGNGAELMQAMAGGSIPIGAPGAVPSTAARAGGLPIEILSCLTNVAGAQALIVGPNSGITQPSQLEGKAVGVVKGTTPELFYRAVVKRYNLDATKIQMQYLDAPGIVTALQRGDIQAGFVFQPFIMRSQSFGAKVLLTGTRSYLGGKDVAQHTFGDYALLVSRKDYLDANPGIVKDIIASIADAYAYIAANPDDAAAMISDLIGQPVADVKVFMKQNSYQMALTPELVSDLTAEAEFLASVGSIKQMVDPKSWIDPGPLKSVRASLVSI